MSKFMKSILILLLTSFALCSLLAGQEAVDVAKGLVPYGSFKGGDIDSVSLTNGNLTLHIPLYSVPQKGSHLHENHVIYYNDKHWTMDTESAQCLSGWHGSLCTTWSTTTGQYRPEKNAHGVYDSSYQGVYVTLDSQTELDEEVKYLYSGGTNGPVTAPLTARYFFTADGSRHYFYESVPAYCKYAPSDPNASTCSPSGDWVNTFPTLDGSNFVPAANGVYDYSGVLHNGLNMTDPNGVSMFTMDSTGFHIQSDSMGRSRSSIVLLSAADAAASPCAGHGVDEVYMDTVPTPGGGNVHYYYCYTQMVGATNFGELSSTDGICTTGAAVSINTTPTGSMYSAVFDGEVQEQRMTAIAVPTPDDSSYKYYTFTYDSWFSLTNLQLPTGGGIAYTWQAIQFGGCPTRAIASRTVYDGLGASHTWNYKWTSTAAPYTVTKRALPSPTTMPRPSNPETVLIPTAVSISDLKGNTTSSFREIVTDPDGNDEVHYMDGINDWRVDSYQGCSSYSSACAAPNGYLLKSSVTTYTNVPSYATEALGLMESGISSHTPATTRVYLYPYGATAQSSPLFTSGKDYSYVSSGGYSTTFRNWMTGNYFGCLGTGAVGPCTDVLTNGPATENVTIGFNQLQSTIEYDWGSGSSVGTAVRTTESHYAWQDNSSLISKGLIGHVSKQYVFAGSGAAEGGSTPVDETDSTFDGNGNLLSTTRNGMLLGTYAYDNNGMVTQATDSAGNTTTHAYGCNGALPTRTTTPSGLYVSGEYDSNCMALTSFTDANGQTSSYSYDGLGRISSATYPDGGGVTFTYDDTDLTVTENQLIEAGRNSTLVVQFDGLGREIRRATKLGGSAWLNGGVDTSGDAWRESDIVYDNRGRKGFVSYPYLTASPLASTNTTGDTYAYDALSRVAKVTHSDNSAVNTYYTARAARVVDENNHARVSQSDALGRLLSVCEVTSSSMGNSSPSACRQDDNQTGFITNYGYDVLGNLTSVAQGVQTRSFTYDSVLHRLLTTNNPESGAIAYSYSTSGSKCSGDPSQPCSKTDARNKTTYYVYDNEHRLLSKYYSDSTPTACFQYGVSRDTTGFTGGRLVNSWTQSGFCATQGSSYTSSSQPTLSPIGPGSPVITQSSGLTYDSMGRALNASQQNIYGAARAHTLAYTYNLAGGVASVSDNLATPLTSNYNYDLAGELSSMTAALGGGAATNLFTNPVYDAAGIHGATLGSGLTIARSYDGRNRLISETDTGAIYSPATTAFASFTITGSEQNVGKSTSSAGSITISGREKFTGTPTLATGSFSISGSEASTQVKTAAATGSAGSITIGGTLQSKQVNHPATSGSAVIGIYVNSGYLSVTANQCPNNPYATCFATIPNAGGVTVTINGTAYSATYLGTSDTTSSVASNLAASINAGSLATATASGSVVTVTAKMTGTASNYSVSTTCSYNSPYFSQCGFTAAGSAFTGGAAAYNTTSYDDGAATAVVGGTTYSVGFSGSSTTSSTIASGLASAINSGSMASASASGSTIYLTSKAQGASANYSVSASVSYDSNVASSPSFTASSASMSGGKDATYRTAYNTGVVTVSINGAAASYAYGQNDTPATIASALASTIGTSCSTYPVTASISSSQVSLTSCAKGASANYSLSASTSTSDSTNFSSSSFAVVTSGNTLTGGTATGGPTVYDSGTASANINGQVFSYIWSGSSMTPATIASGLASAINSGSSYVSAASSGSVISLASKSTGASTNYAYSASTSYSSSNFSSSSFALSTAGSAMTGGTTNGGATVYDNGSVSLTINGATQTVNYAQGDTTATIASKLASAFSGSADVSVSASGSTLALRAKASGAAGNYNYSVSSSTGNASNFSSASFGASAASGALSGGKDASTAGGQTVYSYGVSYANNSNVSSMTDSVMGSWSYGYDDFNRLAAASAADGRGLAWSYDRYGNGSQSGTLSHMAVYDPAKNQQTNVIYDASGNAAGYTDARKGTMTYAYDAESRVTSVSVGGTLAAQYVYDAAGARVAKLNGAGAATAVYVLDPGGVYAELDSGDNIVHRDLYAGGKMVASYDRSGNLHLHLDDWLGTRRAQTDANGVLQMTYESFPFGDGYRGNPISGYSGDDSNEKHFTGKERDTESGLDYFKARYLASSMGRFMTPDWSEAPEDVPYAKLDDPQTLNLYAYVGNNPMSREDEDGHFPFLLALAGGGLLESETPLVAMGPVGWTVIGATAVGVVGYAAYQHYHNKQPANSPQNSQSPANTQAQSTPANPGPNKGAGKNDRKSNPDRVKSAKDKVNDLKTERDKLQSKPNKTPEDKAELDKLNKQIKRETDRMQKSENHSQKAKGQQQ